MNQIVIYKSELSNDQVIFSTDDYRFKHIAEVLKAQKGDILNICVLDDGKTQARIEVILSSKIVLKVLSTPKKVEKNSPIHIELIIGLCRPPTIKKILEHATSMGVAHFHFVKFALCEKSYLSSKILTPDIYKKYLELGLSQSNYYYKWPQLSVYRNYRDLPKFINLSKYILDKKANQTFMHLEDYKKAIICIGPERGFAQSEENYFINELKFKSLKVSSATLRVEMATFYALAQMELFNI